MATHKEIEQVFNQLGIEPSLSTFDDRIKFQKLVYLMQDAFGIDLGFRFTWYIHGPYSPDLTRVMFAKDPGSKMQNDERSSEKVQKMKQFLKDEEMTKDNLELLGSLHFVLKKLEKEKNVKKTLKLFTELKPQFSESNIKQAYEKLKTYI